VIEDGVSVLLLSDDGSTERSLFRVSGTTLMMAGGVFWR
jgi:hypothetical protein